MNARQELESLAREIAEAEDYGITFARRLAAEQWQRLLGYAIDWDAAAAQQREVNKGRVPTFIGEQREVHQGSDRSLIGEQRTKDHHGY
jgi:hypothetical protein